MNDNDLNQRPKAIDDIFSLVNDLQMAQHFRLVTYSNLPRICWFELTLFDGMTMRYQQQAKGLEFGIARTPFHDMYQQCPGETLDAECERRFDAIGWVHICGGFRKCWYP